MTLFEDLFAAVSCFFIMLVISTIVWTLGCVYLEFMGTEMVEITTVSYISIWFASVLFALAGWLFLETE